MINITLVVVIGEHHTYQLPFARETEDGVQYKTRVALHERNMRSEKEALVRSRAMPPRRSLCPKNHASGHHADRPCLAFPDRRRPGLAKTKTTYSSFVLNVPFFRLNNVVVALKIAILTQFTQMEQKEPRPAAPSKLVQQHLIFLIESIRSLNKRCSDRRGTKNVLALRFTHSRTKRFEYRAEGCPVNSFRDKTQHLRLCLSRVKPHPNWVSISIYSHRHLGVCRRPKAR